MAPHLTTPRKSGFSLVEMIIGIFIMSMVIVGGLGALAQANILSEKAGKQARADFILRIETERLRTMDWSEITTLATAINANGEEPYQTLQSITAADLSDIHITASVTASDLNRSGELGKKIFNITLSWDDQLGSSHSERRVMVVTEGGFSAKS